MGTESGTALSQQLDEQAEALNKLVRLIEDACDYRMEAYYAKMIDDAEKWLDDARCEPIPIPEYTFDVHTRKGKKRGRTKEEFFRDELAALNPRVPGLFDDLCK